MEDDHAELRLDPLEWVPVAGVELALLVQELSPPGDHRLGTLLRQIAERDLHVSQNGPSGLEVAGAVMSHYLDAVESDALPGIADRQRRNE